MEGSTLAGKTLKRTDLIVVDVDVHAHEAPAALAPYIEMPWRKTLEHLATIPRAAMPCPTPAFTKTAHCAGARSAAAWW